MSLPHLRATHRHHPDGTTTPGLSILRELLQNADEAGVTTLSFILEPTAPLLYIALTDFRCPSIQGESEELRNILEAFRAVGGEGEFDGAVVKVLVRIEGQVGKDGNSTRKEDARLAFVKFEEELVESMLFLKSVMDITMKVEGEEEVYARAEVTNKDEVTKSRGAVMANLRRDFGDDDGVHFESSVSVYIRYCRRGQAERMLMWKVFHHIRSSLGDRQLTRWGRTEKLVPWVALAALFWVGEGEFSIMPPPVFAHQTVHAYGTFSIMTDQARNKQENGGGVDRDLEWNKALFNECLTHAWSRFLLRLPVESPADAFRNWPRFLGQSPLSEGWDSFTENFLENFLENVVSTELPFWPTSRGRLSAREVFLAREGDRRVCISVQGSHPEPLDTMHALESVGMYITYPPADIYHGARKFFEKAGDRVLTPITAAAFLRTAPDKLACASHEVRQRLLEYLLSESVVTGYSHLEGIELFPMCDGSFSASGSAVLMLPMDGREVEMFFGLWPMMSIDINMVARSVWDGLREGIERLEKETSLKRWGVKDFYVYCMVTHFSEVNVYTAGDIVGGGDVPCGFSESLGGLWEWIISNASKDWLAQLGGLWLVPLQCGRYQRVCPKGAQKVMESSNEELGEFLKSLCEKREGACLLYCSDFMDSNVTGFLYEHKIIQGCDDLGALLDWLEGREDFVSLFSSQERSKLVRYLDGLSTNLVDPGATSKLRPKFFRQIRGLPIFEQISNTSGSTSLNWTNLEHANVNKYVAVTMRSVVPEINDVAFLNSRDPSTLRLLRLFGLAEVPEISQLLDKYILPGIAAQTVPDIVKRLAVFALDNISSLTAAGIAKMAEMKFVPVWARSECGAVTRSLQYPWNCVDPGRGFEDLFFTHESVWIDHVFWGTYWGPMAKMQLMNTVTVELVFDRVSAFSKASNRVEPDRLSRGVELLISISAHLELPVLRRSGGPWLPARRPDGEMVLTRPEYCRDESFVGLVGYALPILPFTVGPKWNRALGWDLLIPAAIIRKQIVAMVEKRDLLGLEVVLGYLAKNSLDEGYLVELRDMKWIIGVSGKVFKPEDIFFKHATRLNPLCDCIANGLGDNYKAFLQLLGVQEKPSILKLRQLIDGLDRGTPLKDEDLDLATDIVLLATELYPKESFGGFRVPDYTGTLRPLPSITAGRPQYSEAEIFFLHPRIPQIVDVLRIPTLDQRQLEDTTNTDFSLDTKSAPEVTIMMVISDKMKHYSIESTFNAFLANAEGSRTATKIGWILDRTENWEKKSLLTEELGDAMGPGLLCWNDSVLEEEDFSGIMDFSSRGKTEGIGIFGPGALAIYYWTSLPQIISGQTFVIFDPEEKHLPINRRTKRRYSCMRLGLDKMREHYPDHLKPFYGVLGFGPESDRLQGTVFRLPFRKSGCTSALVPDNQIIGVEVALELIQDYFIEAKRSLLFLTRINTIQFWIRGSETPEWVVSATRGPADGEIFGGGSVEKVFVESRQFSHTPSFTNDEWILAHRGFPQQLPMELQSTQKENRLKTRCGIAALISHHSEFDGRFFMALPLRWTSKLPVHIHAPFIMTGGRSQIRLEEASKDTESGWNLWILAHGVVDLYLHFLQYLAQLFGELAFKFWPPHEGLLDPLSDRLGKDFWNKVSGSDLKLFTVDGYHPLKTAPQNFPLKDVVFDFLEPEERNPLRPLLYKLGMKNIVSPTGVMSRALQKVLGEIVIVDSGYIGRFLRGNPKNDALHRIWADDDYSFSRLGPFLEFMMKKSSPNSGILKGLRILPLADKTLGVLEDPNASSVSRYYVSKRGTMDIFDYARDLVIHPDVSQTMVDIILGLKLNVTILPFSDLPRLFKNVSEDDKTSSKFQNFLLKFWVSIRHGYEGEPQYAESVLLNLPVHSAAVNGHGLLQAISPKGLDALPAIVSPEGEYELAMCSKLAGLYLVDPRTVSTAMKKAERLTEPDGFMRFIDAIGNLAKLRHKTPETFLPLSLKAGHIPLLRRLLKEAVSEQVLAKSPATTLVLKSLPIWPTMSGKLVNAIDALLVPDLRFCVSWIGDQQRFIEPITLTEYFLFLQLLGVKKIEARQLIETFCKTMGRTGLKPTELESYRSFMMAYLHYMGTPPPDFPLAVDGNLCFRPSSALYDHDEIIFTSAFRDVEKRYFLHPDLRHLKHWYIQGLRSKISGQHYYECATHISKRVGPQGSCKTLDMDAATVFRYLYDGIRFNRLQWSTADMQRLTSVQFVPLFRQISGQPKHRREGMNHVLSAQYFGSLDKCIDAEYLEICWSQSPIYAKRPDMRTLYPRSYLAPPIQVVFKHIEYLAMHRNEVRTAQDIQRYLGDILASYGFLNDHYSKEEHISHKVRYIDLGILDTVMWLNLDELIRDDNTDLFQTSWVAAKDLCLGIEYDFSHYQAVRKVLAVYERLLVALDVVKIQKPNLETMAPDGHQLMNTRERFFSLWQQEKFCDAELDVDGTNFKAHRVMLASGSPYWEKMFTGGWRESGSSRISIKEMPPRTVSAMLHFLYTGGLPLMEEGMDKSENLEHMIDWLVAADHWDMAFFKNHIQEMIVRLDYIRPENVRQILGIAREAQAKKLSKCCEVYIEENKKVMERID